jgi:hypothetical protein
MAHTIIHGKKPEAWVQPDHRPVREFSRGTGTPGSPIAHRLAAPAAGVGLALPRLAFGLYDCRLGRGRTGRP